MTRIGRDGLEPDIIVSTLKHTNLPTLIVEGSGDVSVYRWLEKRMGTGKMDVLQCGGRADLFKIYLRRSEFSGKPVVFLADLDDYLYFGIDVQFKEIIFTNGYSIENDIICSRSIANLMEKDEKSDFESALSRMIEIYSEKVSIRENDRTENLSIHPSAYYDFDKSCFKSTDPFHSYQSNHIWLEHFKGNPKLLIRGKNIINLYTAILSKTGRKSKYSKENILELHLTQRGIPIPIARTLVKIRQEFRRLGRVI